MSQILCRGGEGLRIETEQHAGEDRVSVQLHFVPSSYAAAADASGLEPARCAFVDRPWTPGDPPALHVDGRGDSAAETLRIATYLRNSEHYWSFMVEPGRGMFVATRHGQWKGDRSRVTAAEPRSKVDCTQKQSKALGVTHQIEPRLERIRCEYQNLDGTRSQALNARLDAIIDWLEADTDRPR